MGQSGSQLKTGHCCQRASQQVACCTWVGCCVGRGGVCGLRQGGGFGMGQSGSQLNTAHRCQLAASQVASHTRVGCCVNQGGQAGGRWGGGALSQPGSQLSSGH